MPQKCWIFKKLFYFLPWCHNNESVILLTLSDTQARCFCTVFVLYKVFRDICSPTTDVFTQHHKIVMFIITGVLLNLVIHRRYVTLRHFTTHSELRLFHDVERRTLRIVWRIQTHMLAHNNRSLLLFFFLALQTIVVVFSTVRSGL
jgi:hypothetical protein